jgi:D-sedoheptulose 7-phosphate isomerase
MYLKNLFKNYPKLKSIEKDLRELYNLICITYARGNKILLCGNGGSYSDCEHFAGELMKSFIKKRPIRKQIYDKLCNYEDNDYILLKKLEEPLLAIPLNVNGALESAFMNDVGENLLFAQQLYALGNENDILICFSTSGNSKNIILATKLARVLGIRVVGISGASGGELKKLSDICVCVPEKETYRIQEYHLPIYHTMALMIEDHFFHMKKDNANNHNK